MQLFTLRSSCRTVYLISTIITQFTNSFIYICLYDLTFPSSTTPSKLWSEFLTSYRYCCIPLSPWGTRYVWLGSPVSFATSAGFALLIFVVSICFSSYLFFNLIGTDKPHQYSRPCRKMRIFLSCYPTYSYFRGAARGRFALPSHLAEPHLRLSYPVNSGITLVEAT